MSLRSNWIMMAAVVGCGVVAGCAQEPPRRPLEYGTSGNRPARETADRTPLYEPSLGSGTISGSAGAATKPFTLTGTTQPTAPAGAASAAPPPVGASGAPVTPGTPGPAAPGAGEVAVPPPADAQKTPAAPASNP